MQLATACSICIRRPGEPFTPADAAQVTCPTLVVIGDRDFAGPPEPLVEALPDSRTEFDDDVGAPLQSVQRADRHVLDQAAVDEKVAVAADHRRQQRWD